LKKATDGYIIELDGITVKKGRNLLLENINFCVSQGEFVGVIGPNGAGKTTLLNVIAGFEGFTGRLRLFGEGQTRERSGKTRLRIGYVPQLLDIDRTFPICALEAVLTGSIGRLGLFHNPEKKERQRAMEIMEMMRIGHLKEKPFGQLSGGERQKVLLARAIMQEPEILLLDESTANLDMAIQKEFMDLIDDIHKRQDLTILLVTHDFNLLPPSMNRGLLLNRGRIIFDGDIKTATSGDMLTRLFQYPLETFEHNGKRFVSYG